jgi:hypothetical protein
LPAAAGKLCHCASSARCRLNAPVEDLQCENNEDERVRPGCSGERRQDNVWYSGPANGRLDGVRSEEIVGLLLLGCQTAGSHIFLSGSKPDKNHWV